MFHLLETIKYILPSLVVFVTVYFLFKSYVSNQINLEMMRFNNNLSKDSTNIRLQALERMTMFCSRIDIQNLYYRLVSSDIGPKELKAAMLIAVQQEFEHNASQQLYVSENLWKILNLAKENIQDVIATADGTSNLALLQNIQSLLAERKINPVQLAMNAIRDEASLILGKI